MNGPAEIVCYGYRHADTPLGDPPATKDHKVRWHDYTPYKRRPAMVSAGPIIPTIVQPHPDMGDQKFLYLGAQKRFLSKPPVPDPATLLKFKAFVQDWIEKNLVPLSVDADVTTATWLEKTPYPQHRKEELLTKFNKVQNALDPIYAEAKCFMKDETYPEYKFPRAINSRSDEFKCFFGPFVKNVEEVMYKMPEFIKHVPVKERAKYIQERLYTVGATYFGSDFSSFETHFIAEIMQICENAMFRYMYKNHPEREFLEHLLKTKEGMTTCKFKGFTVKVPATRLSGEMDTSLSNGFSNLMLNLFVLKEKGCTSIKCVVEGDDGLFSFTGPCPTAEDYAKVGFTIKLIAYEELGSASFCGLIYDPEDLIVVTDPLDVCSSLGWLSNKYLGAKDSTKKALLRCKALSLAHQYPGAPVIQTLAHKVLQLTRNISIQRVLDRGGNMSMWEREQLLSAVKDEKKIKKIEVPINTRLLVEREFKLTVEMQLEIERRIDSMIELGPLNIGDCFEPHPHMTDFALKFVEPYTRAD